MKKFLATITAVVMLLGSGGIFSGVDRSSLLINVSAESTIEGKKVTNMFFPNPGHDSQGAFCACITDDDNLYMWGRNLCGQLGNGTEKSSYSPNLIMDNVIDVSLGAEHTACVTKDGCLYTWGSNYYGQLGDGTTTGKNYPVKIMDNVVDVISESFVTICLTQNGDLYMWGNEISLPIKITDHVSKMSLSSVQLISIIKDNGELYNIHYGYGGNEPIKLEKIFDGVSYGFAGYFITCSNELYTYYSSGNDDPVPVKIMSNIVQKTYNGCLTDDGNLYLIKDKNSMVKVLSNVKGILSEDNCNFGVCLTNDGKKYTWGYDIFDIDSANNFLEKPSLLSGYNSAKSFYCGGENCAYISENGELYMMGTNEDGQMGIGYRDEETYDGHEWHKTVYKPQQIIIPVDNSSISLSSLNCVIGKKSYINGTYYTRNPSNINNELSDGNVYVQGSAKINVSKSKEIISADKKTANISIEVDPKTCGESIVTVDYPNSGLSPKKVNVVVEPELILEGATGGNAYNNYADLSIFDKRSRYRQEHQVKLKVENYNGSKTDLEKFLRSITIEREDTTDLVMGYCDYTTSYTISDDGKSAEYIVDITTDDMEIKDYLIIGTKAQHKKILVERNSTTQGWQLGYTASDYYIIDEVTKYCSDDGDLEFLNDVNSHNYSYEARLEILLNYFKNYGVNTVNEGVQYVSSAGAYRRNYEYLINNGNFCASIYNQEIEDDPVKKIALINAGLIFNKELTEPFNFSPDLINHNPGAKKYKKMLKDFIVENQNNEKVLSTSDKLGKFMNNALKTYNAEDLTNARIQSLMKKIGECKDEKELVKLQTKCANIIMSDMEGGTVTLNTPAISKALGYGTSAVSFASATANDIYELINLESEIQAYQDNINFLNTIASSKLTSYDMKLAAQSLLDDIKNGYKKITDDILVNVFKYTKDTTEMLVDYDAWKNFFGEDIANGWKTYKLGVFISNLMIDTGDFVKQTSYTKGYAELADLYSKILQNDKWEFNRDMSKENAWKFFEDYTILWQLRYQGEDQYLKASKMKVFGSIDLPIKHFDTKHSAVESIHSILDGARFHVSQNVTIPKGVQYKQKSVVRCPVDVYVYTKDNKLIAKLEDGVESDQTNEYGRFTVVYNPCTYEFDKVVATNTDDLIIKIKALDDGLVDCNTMKKDSNGNIKMLSFDNEVIKKNDVIQMSMNKEEYSIDLNGDGTIDKSRAYKINDNEYIKIEKLAVNPNTLDLNVGDSAVAEIKVTPNNATYKQISFIPDDDSVAEIVSGKIIAKKAGSIKIRLIADDDPDVFAELTVNVKEKTADSKSSSKTDSSSISEKTSSMASESSSSSKADEKSSNKENSSYNEGFSSKTDKDSSKPKDTSLPDNSDSVDQDTTSDEDDITVKGDVNGDGNINVTDIAMVAAHIKGIKALDENAVKAADVNSDDQVNVTDIAMIAAHIKGIKAIG